MDYSEKILRHVNTYKGIIVDVETDMVGLANGKTTLREVVRHPGGACVAAVTDDGRVAMVRQFRYPFREHLYEIPAGKLEPGEDPLLAAQRELSEETGLEAGRWEQLCVLYTSPGISSERLFLYLATDLRQGAAHPDANELLDVLWLPLDELLEKIDAGEIGDAKTVAGALLAKRRLERKKASGT